jgi:FixJ family two-component response regulator
MSRDRPLIAVVDDEDAVRTALRRLLQSAGLTVETFSGGAEFLTALETHRPDCALLDLQMPEITGLDVLSRLAEMHAGLPVVVITGDDSPDAEANAIRGGASAFLRKPVTERVLLDAITAAIARNPPHP